ncbi:MAG: sulfate adenylyltransferase [Gammaproteobacteria bacterium]|nr:sulfate adenylyltransferase [Gammaproteobacteria bacterium]
MINISSLVLLFFLFTTLPAPSLAYTHTPWSEELYQYIKTTYGETVQERARTLESLILRETNRPINEKLAKVNHFFNQVRWTSDSLHWGKKNYWQTPLETLIDFKGDCEDIAIAKYTALRVMGVPDEKLAMVYVRIRRQPHMVLAYYPSKDADPLILGSMNKLIMKASKRKDLDSIYEFNSSTLWSTDHRMHKLGKGHPEHIALEDELKQRLQCNRHLLMEHNNGKPVVPFDITEL